MYLCQFSLQPFCSLIQIHGHNRARQRDKLGHILEEFATLQDEVSHYCFFCSFLTRFTTTVLAFCSTEVRKCGRKFSYITQPVVPNLFAVFFSQPLNFSVVLHRQRRLMQPYIACWWNLSLNGSIWHASAPGSSTITLGSWSSTCWVASNWSCTACMSTTTSTGESTHFDWQIVTHCSCYVWKALTPS